MPRLLGWGWPRTRSPLGALPQVMGMAALLLGGGLGWDLTPIATATVSPGSYPAPLSGQPRLSEQSIIFRDVPRQVSGVARSTVVRLMSSDRAGSGTLVGRSGRDYWVLTNWHVVAEGRFMTVLAPDGQRYRVLSRQRLGENDLALVGFRASTSYPLAILSEERVQVGDPVFAVGYAMYDRRTYEPTLNQGLRPFRLLSGWVSLILPKPMPEGYQLGYTSPVEVGMSGGPVLDRWGAVVGVNGRSMGREADFGVYTFADGTDPDPELLNTMERSSWGIPITRRLIAIFSLSLEH